MESVSKNIPFQFSQKKLEFDFTKTVLLNLYNRALP